MDVREWPTPSIVLVVVIRLKFRECFLHDELSRVFDVVGVIDNGVVDVVPVPSFTVKSIDFVADSPGFETSLMQVLRTSLVDGKSKG